MLIPFWAVWPFEAMIAPKKQQRNISELSGNETLLYAEAISVITKAYDKLFNTSFPYSSGIHQSPTDGEANDHWHWHMSSIHHYYVVQRLRNLWLVTKCLAHLNAILPQRVPLKCFAICFKSLKYFQKKSLYNQNCKAFLCLKVKIY